MTASRTRDPREPGDSTTERCRQGDILAFREVYDTWSTRLFSFALRFHGNRQDAEDSLQDAFLNMYRAMTSFRGEAGIGTWLYRITYNACVSRSRGKRSTEEHSDFSDEGLHPRTAHPTADPLLLKALEEEVAALSEAQRSVFLLYASEGFTHPEIADILDIRIGTSKSHLHRAREALRRGLQSRGIRQEELTP